MEEAGWVRDYYDRSYFAASTAAVSAVATEREIRFLYRHVISSPRERIVDACSGQGRHALRLADDGHEIVAIDVTPLAVQELESSMTPSLTIRGINDDVRNLGSYVDDGWADVALCLHNSFGYADDEQAHFDFVAALAACLRRGGFLVLDVPNRDRIVRDVLQRGWERTEEGTYILGEYLYDHQFQRVKGLEHRIPVTGARSTHVLSVRLFSLDELHELFAAAHLEVHDVFGDYNSGAYTDHSERLLILARKNETAW